MTRRLRVELTQAEAINSALAMWDAAQEQGDMEGMASPQKIAAELAASARVSGKLYAAGFRLRVR